MRINDVNRAGGIQPYKKVQPSKADGYDVKKTSNRDDVQISTEAQQALQQAKLQGIGATEERLAELKKAIQNGTYEVDPNKLAEKLLPYL